MRPISRIIYGGFLGGILTGLAGIVDSGQESALIAAIGGLIIGVLVGFIIVLLIQTHLLRHSLIAFMIGGIAGGFGFALAGNFDIRGGDVISNTPLSFAIGFAICGFIGASLVYPDQRRRRKEKASER
jgi:preprotein translocase subunit Sss1